MMAYELAEAAGHPVLTTGANTSLAGAAAFCKTPADAAATSGAGLEVGLGNGRGVLVFVGAGVGDGISVGVAVGAGVNVAVGKGVLVAHGVLVGYSVRTGAGKEIDSGLTPIGAHAASARAINKNKNALTGYEVTAFG